MIIYIHGFAGSGLSSKAQEFKKYFSKTQSFISPSLSNIPRLALQTLEDIILLCKDKEEIKLIGSSLGGFYAIYLANKYNLKALLINPSTKPFDSMQKRVLGNAKSFYDNSGFEVTKEHCNSLKNFDIKEIKNQSKFLLCVQKGDEILNYKLALEKLPNANHIIEEKGSHAFSNIKDHFEDIESFFLSKN